jgi:hypothetical protein
MSSIDEQLFSIETDTQHANKVKDLVVASLIRQGLISEEDGLDYAERFQVIIYKGSWYKRFFDKYIKNDSNKTDRYYYRVIEMQEKKPMTLNDLT